MRRATNHLSSVQGEGHRVQGLKSVAVQGVWQCKVQGARGVEYAECRGYRVWGTGCDMCRLQGVHDWRGAAYKGHRMRRGEGCKLLY